MKLSRAALSPALVEQASRSIAWRLLRHEALQRAGVVACYLSIGREVITDHLIESLLAIGKTVAAPRITTGLDDEPGMVFSRIDALHTLTRGPHGLREPEPTAAIWRRPEAEDVCIVPAVALTPRGDRLGMGGGYYDRWLAANPQVITIAPAFESQLVDELPVEPHDQRIRWIVTEQRVIDCDS